MIWILVLVLVLAIAALAVIAVIALRNRSEVEPSRARLRVLRLEAARGLVVVGNLGFAPAHDVTANLLEDGRDLGTASWPTIDAGGVATFQPAGAIQPIRQSEDIELSVHLEWMDRGTRVHIAESTDPLVLR